MAATIDRRQFLGSAMASSLFTIVPRHVLGGPGYVPPSEKMTVAHIGMGTQGFNELGSLLAHPEIQVVSVCDPNRDSNDYVQWGKDSVRRRICALLGDDSWRKGVNGGPGGREVGRHVVDTYYGKQRSADSFKACSAYADFRELLAQEKDLDAVKIMTPDHLHATISIAAMKKGKHVLMHKPVANRMAEGRLVRAAAKKYQRATHLLAHGSGAGNALIVKAIQQGVIGTLREVHNWSNRPVWPQYPQIPSGRPTVPAGFDWDLWLGPERYRPYHPHYTHTVFRGWYDFGGGSMADMGIYSLWPVFTGLDLDCATSAEAWASHTCAIRDYVSRPVQNDYSYPAACSLRFRFASPALDLFWYDGGMKPRLPHEVEVHDVAMSREGILFVGDEGAVMAGFHGQEPRLFKGGRQQPLQVKEASATERRNHLDHWLGAARGGAPSPGSFLSAAAITDTVNLGTVALRAGRKVRFDSAAMKITNVAEANRYLVRAYRSGWEL